MDNYFLPENYISRTPTSPQDSPTVDAERSKEPYMLAFNIAKDNNWKKIINIGCGSGENLIDTLSYYDTDGEDTAKNIENCTQKYPTRKWRVLDFSENTNSQADIVICTDIISKIDNPIGLIDYINCIDFKMLIMTTALADGDLGPPKDTRNTREWTAEQFKNLMSSHFSVIRSYIHYDTKNNVQMVLATKKAKISTNKFDAAIIHRSTKFDRLPIVAELKNICKNTRILEAKVPKWEQNEHNRAIRGCTISHLSAIKAMLKDKPFLVLEDDAIAIDENLKEFLDIDEYPEDAGIILLGGDVSMFGRADKNGFREIFPKFWGTQAVLYLPKLNKTNFLLNAFEIVASACMGMSYDGKSNGLCLESVLLQGALSAGLKIYRPKKMAFTTSSDTCSDSTSRKETPRTTNIITEDKDLEFRFNINSNNVMLIQPDSSLDYYVEKLCILRQIGDFYRLFSDISEIKSLDNKKIFLDSVANCSYFSKIGGETSFVNFKGYNIDSLVENKEYLEKASVEIPCDNLYTCKLLESINVKAVVGNTLLNANRKVSVQTDDVVVAASSFQISRDIIHKPQDMYLPDTLSLFEKLQMAAYRIELLASAKCVITDSKVSALICCANNVPCLLIYNGDRRALSGHESKLTIEDMINHNSVLRFIGDVNKRVKE